MLAEELEGDESFTISKSIPEQYINAFRILRAERPDPVPYSVLGDLFNVNKGTVRKQVLKYQDRLQTTLSTGRPTLLNEAQIAHLRQEIIDQYEKRSPKSISELVQFIRTEFGIPILPNTLHHILARDPMIKSCTAIPIETKRAEVTVEQIQEHFERLSANLSGVPAHFVFNIDEMGHQEWADATQKVCFVPVSHTEKQVYYPVPRMGKRITLLACVAADGSFLKPTVIIPRKTYDEDLYLLGMTPEKVKLYSQENGYVETSIFNDWFKNIFVPEIERRRDVYSYNSLIYLMLDNCSPHTNDDFNTLCSEFGVIPVFLPPHSSNQTQVLDLSIFGLTKRLIAHINRVEDTNIQSDHIAKVVCSFMSAASPMNIIKSFRNAGISLAVEHGTLLCKITPETARCLWDREKVLRTEEQANEED
jgi:hypothetical protein